MTNHSNPTCLQTCAEMCLQYWNRYPGARVDSEMPFYQLNIPEVYRDWNFSSRFPDHRELRQYMAHIDRTLDLRKDVTFDARVNDAMWDKEDCLWTVKTLQGHVARCKYLMLASGLLHRTYTPDFAGLKDYKGELYHSGDWPEDFSAKGKKVAIVGAGAVGLSIDRVCFLFWTLANLVSMISRLLFKSHRSSVKRQTNLPSC